MTEKNKVIRLALTSMHGNVERRTLRGVPKSSMDDGWSDNSTGLVLIKADDKSYLINPDNCVLIEYHEEEDDE